MSEKFDFEEALKALKSGQAITGQLRGRPPKNCLKF